MELCKLSRPARTVPTDSTTACQPARRAIKVPADADGNENWFWAVAVKLDSIGEEKENMAKVGGVAASQLRSFVERIERLEDEKQALTNDIREIYSEAKGAGFDVKVLRQVVRLRKMDAHDRSQMEAVLDVYKRALDM